MKPGVPSISAAGWMLNQTLNQGTVPLRQMKPHGGGVEPGPIIQVLGRCWGLPLLGSGLGGSGLQFWQHQPRFPTSLLPHKEGLAAVSTPPTHTPTGSVFPSPVLTAIIFKLLFRPFFFFLSSSDSSVVKIISSTFSLSYLSACAGGAAESKEEG